MTKLHGIFIFGYKKEEYNYDYLIDFHLVLRVAIILISNVPFTFSD